MAGHDWDADPDYEFRTADRPRPGAAAAAVPRRLCAQPRGGGGSPDQLSVGRSRDGAHWDLRWILLHMLEETARHAGHADLLREAIDGTVGE